MEKTTIGGSLNQASAENMLPFALGTQLDRLIFLSGMVSKDLKTGRYIGGTIEEETAQVLENIKVLLEGAGSSMDKILRATVFLADIGDFERMNRVYKRYFPTQTALAARSTVQAKLVGAFQIEIEVTAFV
ncbi:MAG: hypothetical protein HFG20_02765 [Anaerotruncus sp.]|nr:hypothetical protein [Anaerotruncus sp.]